MNQTHQSKQKSKQSFILNRDCQEKVDKLKKKVVDGPMEIGVGWFLGAFQGLRNGRHCSSFN